MRVLKANIYFALRIFAGLFFAACEGNKSEKNILLPPISFVVDNSLDIDTADVAKEIKPMVITICGESSGGIDIAEIPHCSGWYTRDTMPKYRTQSKAIWIEMPKELKNNIYAFYFSPQMLAPNYPYQMRFGSDNNFLQVRSTSSKSYGAVIVPDTIDAGAKLLFRIIGYEPFEVNIDSIVDETIPLDSFLVPKTYRMDIVLYKKEGEIRQAISHEELKIKTFYGECNPIYFEDGGHADPICAFSSLGCSYPYLSYNCINQALKNSGEDLDVLYKKLQKGKECSFMVSVETSRKLTITPEQLPIKKGLDSLQKSFQSVKWELPYLTESGSKYFNVRLVLSAKKEKKENLFSKLFRKKEKGTINN